MPGHSARAERDHRSLRANRARGPQGPARPPAERASCRQRAGRAPERPIARRARRNIIARTASRSTGGPMPAACERIRASWSSSPFGRYPGAQASRTPSRRRRPAGPRRRGGRPRRCFGHGRPRLVGQSRRHSMAGHGDDVSRLDLVAGQLDRCPRHPGHSITSPVPRSRQAEFLSLGGDQDAKRFELSAAGGTLNSARTPASRSSDLDLSVRSRTVDPNPSADTRPETQEVGHGGQRWYSTREARHWGGAPRPWRRSARTGTGDPVAA